jgi:Acetyltransferase (GNAT) domain
MTPAISVAGLTRRYRGELALSDVTPDLEPDSITGLLGTAPPVAPGAPVSPYRQAEDRNAVVRFSIIEPTTGELAGEAVVSGIDLHNRQAEIGLVLRPAFRGRHLGPDVVRVLCHYGFAIRALHRIRITTLAGRVLATPAWEARAAGSPGPRGTVVVACGGECTVNPGPDADALFGRAARAGKSRSWSRWASTARPGSCPGSPIGTVRRAGPRSRAARWFGPPDERGSRD